MVRGPYIILLIFLYIFCLLVFCVSHFLSFQYIIISRDLTSYSLKKTDMEESLAFILKDNGMLPC
jgi:hypothetical protein